MNKYHGKRFAGFLLSSVLLLIGYFANQPEQFAVFAQTLGILYGAYLTGQSATDFRNGKAA